MGALASSRDSLTIANSVWVLYSLYTEKAINSVDSVLWPRATDARFDLGWPEETLDKPPTSLALISPGPVSPTFTLLPLADRPTFPAAAVVNNNGY
jgi:hypothetical protein